MTEPLTPQQINDILWPPTGVVAIGGVPVARVTEFDIVFTETITLEEAKRIAQQIHYHFVIAADGTITRTQLPPRQPNT